MTGRNVKHKIQQCPLSDVSGAEYHINRMLPTVLKQGGAAKSRAFNGAKTAVDMRVWTLGNTAIMSIIKDEAYDGR